MSFDIFYIPCRFDDKETTFTSPSTGETKSRRKCQPLTATELQAVKTLLKKVNARESEDGGFYGIEFPDGGHAQVFGMDQTGCMVALHGITPDILAFLLDLVRVGNMWMRPAMEEVVNIVPSFEHAKMLPPGLENITVCDSPEQLGVLLSKGLDAWKHYRDQVCE